MSIQNPIANMFVCIRNAQCMGKSSVAMPASKLKLHIAELLQAEGYLADVQVEGDKKAILTLYLKYHCGRPVIAHLKQVSRPSCRVYRRVSKLPKVIDGAGVAIISTPKGIMSDRRARALGHGGEILGEVA